MCERLCAQAVVDEVCAHRLGAGEGEAFVVGLFRGVVGVAHDVHFDAVGVFVFAVDLVDDLRQFFFTRRCEGCFLWFKDRVRAKGDDGAWVLFAWAGFWHAADGVFLLARLAKVLAGGVGRDDVHAGAAIFQIGNAQVEGFTAFEAECVACVEFGLKFALGVDEACAQLCFGGVKADDREGVLLQGGVITVVDVDRDDARFFVTGARAVDDQARLFYGNAGGCGIGVTQGFGDVEFGFFRCVRIDGLRGGPFAEGETGKNSENELPA